MNTDASRSTRRLLRFNLRTLLVGILIASVFLGWFANQLHNASQQRQAREAIEKEFGCDNVFIGFSYDRLDEFGRYDSDGERHCPDWAIDWLGIDFFSDVAYLQLSLGIDSTRVPDSALRNIGELYGLRALVLGNCKTTEQALVQHLESLPNLALLDINNGQIQNLSLDHLSRLTRLHALLLPGALPNADVSQLGRLDRLRLLSIPWLDNPDLTFIAELTDLEYLELSGRVAYSERTQLSHLTKLETLILRGVEVDGSWLASLSGLTHLKSLDLYATSLSDEDLTHLGNLNQLEFLNLKHTHVSDDSLASLSGLQSLKHLFFDEGPAIYHPKRNITDVGLKHIARLTHLESLGLKNTGISDAGLEFLTDCRQIEYLDLGDTGITDAGLQRLSGLRRLKMIDVDGTQVTPAGIHLLKQALPDCLIRS